MCGARKPKPSRLERSAEKCHRLALESESQTGVSREVPACGAQKIKPSRCDEHGAEQCHCQHVALEKGFRLRTVSRVWVCAPKHVRRRAIYALSAPPSLLLSELRQYVAARTAVFDARRAGGAVMSTTVEGDTQGGLRFFGYLHRTHSVPQGACGFTSRSSWCGPILVTWWRGMPCGCGRTSRFATGPSQTTAPHRFPQRLWRCRGLSNELLRLHLSHPVGIAPPHYAQHALSS
mmetsp:Transcript_38546/g.87600  ORF Transcript_38546/g.87600 Transcript_38546/m.87600 type:complete len:234 (+) Transcript_38546:1053-1754(+)